MDPRSGAEFSPAAPLGRPTVAAYKRIRLLAPPRLGRPENRARVSSAIGVRPATSGRERAGPVSISAGRGLGGRVEYIAIPTATYGEWSRQVIPVQALPQRTAACGTTLPSGPLWRNFRCVCRTRVDRASMPPGRWNGGYPTNHGPAEAAQRLAHVGPGREDGCRLAKIARWAKQPSGVHALEAGSRQGFGFIEKRIVTY
jgi:hypothetical protein